MKILVAGASGVLGRSLVVRLRDAGHDVWGIAHRKSSLSALEAVGVQALEANALDRSRILFLVEQIKPDVVIDQLTALPADPFDLPERLPDDRKLRLQGGGHLFDAANICGVKRYIQQSSAFYLDGHGGLATEDSSMKTDAPGHIGESARMYEAVEKRVFRSSTMQGTALRYGFFYGPGSWYWKDGTFSRHLHKGTVAVVDPGSSVLSFISIEDAAKATVAALTAPSGIYNVVDNQPTKMRDWQTSYAQWIGAPPPAHCDPETALQLYGEETVYYQTKLDGACNQKAKALLCLEPQNPPWLDM